MAAVRPEIDTSVAHIARIQDYWLGGEDHFAADRIAGDEAIQALPAFGEQGVGVLAPLTGFKEAYDQLP